MNDSEKNNNRNTTELYESYTAFIKVAIRNNKIPEDAHALLRRQGELMGLCQDEMINLEMAILNYQNSKEHELSDYKSLLKEYKKVLNSYDKRTIADRLDEIDLPDSIKASIEKEILGCRVKTDFEKYLQDNSFNNSDEYDVLKQFRAQYKGRTKLFSKVSLGLISRLVKRLNDSMMIRNINAEEIIPDDVEIGPTVLRFKVKLQEGERLASVQNAIGDIGRELESHGTPSVGNIPSTNAIYIDVPRLDREIIPFDSFMDCSEFRNTSDAEELKIAVGIDTNGKYRLANLQKTQHMLIAGTTGSGKSVFLRSIIASLVLKHRPEHLRIIIIDSKGLDFNIFAKLPHLDPIDHIINDPSVAKRLIMNLTEELDRRKKQIQYKAISVESYNQTVSNKERIPYIIVLIDEYADLVSQMDGDERANFEKHMGRIAQVSRALGIRMIISTQRPDAKVITPLIKANFPARVAFNVPDYHNSQIILDSPGAEDLLGCGDMLFSVEGCPPERLQAPLLSEEQMLFIVNITGKYLNYSASIFNQKRLSAANPFEYSIFPLVLKSKLKLRPREICFLEFDSFFYETKNASIRSFVAAGAGSNGIGLGIGGGVSTPVPQLILLDTVRIYITNQRFVFTGEKTCGAIDYNDIISFDSDAISLTIFSERRQNAFCFHIFQPQSQGFFQSFATLFGIEPEIKYLSAGRTVDVTSLKRILRALLYLSHDPGMQNLDYSTDPHLPQLEVDTSGKVSCETDNQLNNASCIVRIKGSSTIWDL